MGAGDEGSGALVPAAEAADRSPALAPEVVEAARGYAAASRAASTRLKYERAWDAFAAWCAAQGHDPLPAHPAVVAGWLAAEAARGMSPAWVQVQLAGHCHVGQLWLERTRQAKLAACRPSPPPTPAT
ncbi:hypothetical protein ACI2KH_24990, partial [Roseomonas mucosa]